MLSAVQSGNSVPLTEISIATNSGGCDDDIMSASTTTDGIGGDKACNAICCDHVSGVVISSIHCVDRVVYKMDSSSGKSVPVICKCNAGEWKDDIFVG